MNRIILMIAVLLVVGRPLVAPAETTSPQTAFEDKKTSSASNKTAETSETPHLLAPLVWGCDDEWKLQVGGEVRLRPENRRHFPQYPDDPDFSPDLLRTKLNFELFYRDFVRAFLEIMDSQVYGTDVQIKQTAPWHVHQAFLEFYSEKVSPWGIRLGRQEVQLGSRRLVESSRWNNLPRTFQGAKLFYHSPDVDLDAFVFQPDLYDVTHGDQEVTGRPRPEQRFWFYGLFATIKTFEPHKWDVYWLTQSDLDDHRTYPAPSTSEDGVYGTTDRQTVGSRAYGSAWKEAGCGELLYDIEGGYQFGHHSTDSISAYFLHGDTTYQWDCDWKPALQLVGNIASGDRTPDDGQTNTFNHLYGSTHTPYGIIDFVRLQNLREIAVVGTAEPTKKLKCQLEYHWFWLDSKTDSWYDAAGVSLGRSKEGLWGRAIGQEADLITTYKQNQFLTWEAGYAYFMPGTFAKNAGHPDTANFVYLQAMFTF